MKSSRLSLNTNLSPDSGERRVDFHLSSPKRSKRYQGAGSSSKLRNNFNLKTCALFSN